MATRRTNSAIPDNINEEYYQISSEILSSFPKYRPPVDLFFFNEDIAVLAPFSRKGSRLTNEQVEEVARLCDEGNIFVSRSDHHIYSEHIVKQLDLVLQDKNLKEKEIVDICRQALLNRFEAFYNQPVKPVFDSLQKDCLVVTEYLFGDLSRINAFMRRLDSGSSPALHAVNTMSIGLWLWIKKDTEKQRKTLDNLAMAFLTHDIGMSKMPPFLLSRPGPLKPDEKEKIIFHPLQGAKIMQKMETVNPEILHACLEHHEFMDGTGYPQHSKGEQLHLAGKICAVADSFAAMITNRIYAPAKDPLKAASELAQDNRYDISLGRQLVAAYATKQF